MLVSHLSDFLAPRVKLKLQPAHTVAQKNRWKTNTNNINNNIRYKLFANICTYIYTITNIYSIYFKCVYIEMAAQWDKGNECLCKNKNLNLEIYCCCVTFEFVIQNIKFLIM